MKTMSTRAVSSGWQAGFLALLPAIQRSAELAFQRRDPETCDDAMSEVLAHAACAYAALHKRGLAARAFASPLARYAIRGYYAGRRTGTSVNSADVYAQRDGLSRVSVDQLIAGRTGQANWRDCLIDNRFTPVFDQVAFRMDFPAWLATQTPRDRQVAEQLAVGHSTQEVSRELGISSGRVSQLRKELAESWRAFIEDP